VVQAVADPLPAPPPAPPSGTGSVDTAAGLGLVAEFARPDSPVSVGGAAVLPHPDAEIAFSDWDGSGSFDDRGMAAAAAAVAATAATPAKAASAPPVGLRGTPAIGTGSLDLDASGSDWDASGSLDLPGGDFAKAAAAASASVGGDPRSPPARFGFASQLDALVEEDPPAPLAATVPAAQPAPEAARAAPAPVAATPASVAATAVAAPQPLGSKAKAAAKAPDSARMDSARVMADLGFSSDDGGMEDEDEDEDPGAASTSWDR